MLFPVITVSNGNWPCSFHEAHSTGASIRPRDVQKDCSSMCFKSFIIVYKKQVIQLRDATFWRAGMPAYSLRNRSIALDEKENGAPQVRRKGLFCLL